MLLIFFLSFITMERKDRFDNAINYLRGKGIIHTQRDIAEKMNAAPSNVSKARKGEESVLTDSFLKRFNRAFNNIFDIDYLLNGIGKLCPEAMEATDEEIFEPDKAAAKEESAEKDKEIEDLKKTVEQLKDELLKSRERENELLRRLLEGKQ